MKNVAGILMQVVEKFGDHWRWSEYGGAWGRVRPLLRLLFGPAASLYYCDLVGIRFVEIGEVWEFIE